LIEVVELTRDDVVWPFHGVPYIKVGGKYERREEVDPFPCYTHDAGLARELAAYIDSLWYIPFKVNIHLVPFDSPARTNGWATMSALDYGSDGKCNSWVADIVLCGKRVPIHPAITRYLLGHEPGHVVEDAIAYGRGLVPDTRAILPEYAALRGLTYSNAYGGGRWDSNVGEMLANDFRILIAQLETEFWPHPGIPRPEDCPQIIDWWQTERQKMEMIRKVVEEDLRLSACRISTEGENNED
jgi:hypothetical protein